ncbi:MAG: 4Fe-4S binding protein [Oscillospiraceae bacterium]|nr:4Fe-4S binding protein [Oscillospiraceae bacterium]
MKRIYVNEKWCLGCRLCEYYCAFAETGKKNMALALKDVKINPRIRVESHEDINFAVNCRHCDEPLCVKSCITGALSVTDGVVKINSERCVECYTCILVCPFGAIVPSDSGVLKKCELCLDIIEGSPACVKGCPNNAIVYESTLVQKGQG